MGGKELVPVDPLQFACDQAEVESGFWSKVRRTLGGVPFVEESIAAYYCAFDRDTPLTAKATLMAALAYFVVPADLVPDLIAWLGFTDDAAVLAAAVRAVAPHIGDRHREQARRMLGTLTVEPPTD